MSFGLQVFDATGALIFDTTGAVVLFYYDEFDVTSSSGSRGYPELAGKIINIQTQINAFIDSSATHIFKNIAIDYDAGFPRVTWANAATGFTSPSYHIIVFRVGD